MDKKIQFLLEHCFRSKIRERSYYITDFIDNSGREIISTAKSIANYIDVNSVIAKERRNALRNILGMKITPTKEVYHF